MTIELASVTDLAVMLNKTFTAGEQAQAQILIEQASSTVQVRLHQTIGLVEGDVATLAGNWSSTLVLPEKPVSAVASVVIDSTDVTDVSGYVWDGQQTLYRGRGTFSTNGLWQPWPGDVHLFWGGPSATVTVTYTHGFDEIPSAVSGVVLAMAARAMRDPGGTTTSETIGPFSRTTSAGTGAMSITPDELRTCRAALGLA